MPLIMVPAYRLCSNHPMVPNTLSLYILSVFLTHPQLLYEHFNKALKEHIHRYIRWLCQGRGASRDQGCCKMVVLVGLNDFRGNMSTKPCEAEYNTLLSQYRNKKFQNKLGKQSFIHPSHWKKLKMYSLIPFI